MSITAEAPPRGGVVELHGQPEEVVQEHISLLQRAAQNAKAFGQKTVETVKKGASWFWGKLKQFGRWIKNTARTVVEEGPRVVQRTWAWIRGRASRARTRVADAARRFWSWSTPAREWLIRPIRWAYNTTWGLAIPFRLALVIGVPVLFIAIASGLIGSAKSKKRIRELTRAFEYSSGEQSSPHELAYADSQQLEAEEEAYLTERTLTAQRQATHWSEEGNRTMTSESEGKHFLAMQRMLGSTLHPDQIFDHYQSITYESMPSREAADVLYDWVAVRRGMLAEERQIHRGLLQVRRDHAAAVAAEVAARATSAEAKVRAQPVLTPGDMKTTEGGDTGGDVP